MRQYFVQPTDAVAVAVAVVSVSVHPVTGDHPSPMQLHTYVVCFTALLFTQLLLCSCLISLTSISINCPNRSVGIEAVRHGGVAEGPSGAG